MFMIPNENIVENISNDINLVSTFFSYKVKHEKFDLTNSRKQFVGGESSNIMEHCSLTINFLFHLQSSFTHITFFDFSC